MQGADEQSGRCFSIEGAEMKLTEFESLMIIIITLQIIMSVVSMLGGNEARALWCLLAANFAFQCIIVNKIKTLEGRK